MKAAREERGDLRDGETIAAQFERGLARGKDPTRGETDDSTGTATTERSAWLGQVCPLCGHTFRRGDRVDLAELGAKVTHSRHAGCPGEGVDDKGALPAHQAFYEGLRQAYPPPPGLRVERLLPGHPLLAAMPTGPFRRPTCAICGHSLRPLDEVVVCPCQSDAPLCRGAVHRDSSRALYCWDEWSRSKLSRYCPVTSRKLT